jgi:hypothetical protein
VGRSELKAGLDGHAGVERSANETTLGVLERKRERGRGATENYPCCSSRSLPARGNGGTLPTLPSLPQFIHLTLPLSHTDTIISLACTLFLNGRASGAAPLAECDWYGFDGGKEGRSVPSQRTWTAE